MIEMINYNLARRLSSNVRLTMKTKAIGYDVYFASFDALDLDNLQPQIPVLSAQHSQKVARHELMDDNK